MALAQSVDELRKMMEGPGSDIFHFMEALRRANPDSDQVERLDGLLRVLNRLKNSLRDKRLFVAVEALTLTTAETTEPSVWRMGPERQGLVAASVAISQVFVGVSHERIAPPRSLLGPELDFLFELALLKDTGKRWNELLVNFSPEQLEDLCLAIPHCCSALLLFQSAVQRYVQTLQQSDADTPTEQPVPPGSTTSSSSAAAPAG